MSYAVVSFHAFLSTSSHLLLRVWRNQWGAEQREGMAMGEGSPFHVQQVDHLLTLRVGFIQLDRLLWQGSQTSWRGFALRINALPMESSWAKVTLLSP